MAAEAPEAELPAMAAKFPEGELELSNLSKNPLLKDLHFKFDIGNWSDIIAIVKQHQKYMPPCSALADLLFSRLRAFKNFQKSSGPEYRPASDNIMLEIANLVSKTSDQVIILDTVIPKLGQQSKDIVESVHSSSETIELEPVFAPGTRVRFEHELNECARAFSAMDRMMDEQEKLLPG
ncbi:MAG: hypothetical protein Q9208_001396 [Pyrenodesmia sp. 3 TL-2023]